MSKATYRICSRCLERKSGGFFSGGICQKCKLATDPEYRKSWKEKRKAKIRGLKKVCIKCLVPKSIKSMQHGLCYKCRYETDPEFRKKQLKRHREYNLSPRGREVVKAAQLRYQNVLKNDPVRWMEYVTKRREQDRERYHRDKPRRSIQGISQGRFTPIIPDRDGYDPVKSMDDAILMDSILSLLEADEQEVFIAYIDSELDLEKTCVELQISELLLINKLTTIRTKLAEIMFEAPVI